jgi:hypothetical protein
MEWPEGLIRRLCEDWAAGHSTSQIAHRLGVSKNAVVGKAHRLDLPARPSPIIRGGVRTPVKPRIHRPHRAISTLPVLTSVIHRELEEVIHVALPPHDDPLVTLSDSVLADFDDAADPGPDAISEDEMAKVNTVLRANEARGIRPDGTQGAPKHTLPGTAVQVHVNVARLSGATCQFPLNDGVLPSGKKGWLFCDRPAAVGSVYCGGADGHHNRCYGKPGHANAA